MELLLVEGSKAGPAGGRLALGPVHVPKQHHGGPVVRHQLQAAPQHARRALPIARLRKRARGWWGVVVVVVVMMVFVVGAGRGDIMAIYYGLTLPLEPCHSKVGSKHRRAMGRPHNFCLLKCAAREG